MSRTRRLAVAAAGLLAIGWPRATAAQAPSPSGPSFFVARYASRAALTFYGGYQVGRILAFVGFVQNPRTNYREALLGAGATWTRGTNSLLIGVAAADATDGWYGQLYLLPTLHLARLEISGTIEAYQPLDAGGSRQLGTTPLNALVVLSPRWAAGVSYLLSAQEGVPDGHALGPSVRVGVPKGSIRLDLIRRLRAAPNEVRLTFTTSF